MRALARVRKIFATTPTNYHTTPILALAQLRCCLPAEACMQMLLLVGSNASEAKREVSLVVVAKPGPRLKPLRLKRAFLHSRFPELTLWEAEGSWLVWLISNGRRR